MSDALPPELEALLAKAKEKWEQMTPEQRKQMIHEQAQSWVRSEAKSSDAIEAAERARYREKMNRHSRMYRFGKPKINESDFDV
jgi:hypothetical protein